jgi:hydroxypyruvate isomerase
MVAQRLRRARAIDAIRAFVGQRDNVPVRSELATGEINNAGVARALSKTGRRGPVETLAWKSGSRREQGAVSGRHQKQFRTAFTI